MKVEKVKECAMKQLDSLRNMGIVPKQIDGRKTIRTCTSLELLEQAAYLLEQMRDIDASTDVGRKRIKSLNTHASLALRCAQ
jgi:hypothetical protein